MTRGIVALSVLLTLALPRMGAAQVDHLEVVDAPALVSCDPRPYFRLVVSPVDAERRPVGVTLGSGDPRTLWAVSEGDRAHNVVYVGIPGSEGTIRGSYAMLLLDTSGSMNGRMPSGRTRFEVAKEAVRASLATFADGVDYMAIAPFDSRNVATRIRNATFESTRRGVEAQLDAIATPLRDNNTAVYSAVAEALPILKARADAGSPVSLVVFTDGENDVNHPGDDPGLLGDEGLARVRDMAERMKVPLTTVGFGVGGNSRAQTALRDIAWPNQDNYYDAATDAAQLTRIFQITRQKLTDRIVVLFGPVRDQRQQLTGQSAQFKVRFRTGDSIVSSRLEPIWNSPGVGAPVANARCTDAESKAILDSVPGDSTGPESGPKRLIIFVTFAAILAGLWFAAPRLVWPESYVPKPTLRSMGVPPAPQVPYIPGAPSVPSVSSLPNFQRPRGGGSPAPDPRADSGGYPSAGGYSPRGAGRPVEPTIVVPPRSQPRSAPPRPREPSRGHDPDSRGADDATIYQPPPRKPRPDR